MQTKNVIYLFSIIILLIILTSVLTLYFTQDFSVKLEFKDQIEYEDIDFITRQNNFNPETEVLSSANVNIGELILKNNGYFTETYIKPKIIGCLNLKEGIKSNYQREIENMGFEINYGNENEYIRHYKDINIKVGETKIINLSANYRNYNIPMEEFTKNKLKSISIHIINEKEINPLTGYGTSYPNNCRDLKNKEPDKEILII
jgi:hypothetical protein